MSEYEVQAGGAPAEQSTARFCDGVSLLCGKAGKETDVCRVKFYLGNIGALLSCVGKTKSSGGHGTEEQPTQSCSIT